MISIRTLGVDDYDAICAVWRASGVDYQPTGRESPASFARQMQSGLQTVLGAVNTDEADRLVGVVVVTHDGRKGWINRLGVAPDHQRQGIGAMLVHAAEDLLHAQGLTITAALVVHGNDASLNLFKRAGYHVHDVYYLTKRDHPDA
ncbi:MAG: GNAT family N-acetyltransferase [Anaerolineae bacterium]|nr:GNAT family N-acetyltransferase [Anaerolineae bacterium]